MDPKSIPDWEGPKNADEARQFIATRLLEALETEEMKYARMHFEDWNNQTQTRFNKAQEFFSIRIKKLGKIQDQYFYLDGQFML